MSELSLGHPENVSAEKRWLASYPPGVPSEIPASAHASLVELLEKSCAQFADRKAFSSMGKSLTYRELDAETRAVAAWLQSRGLEKGDRVAVMMPNILQNPVAVYGILRAGMIVVNVNPLYTPRELEHQLKDSGAKAIFVLENFAHVAQQAVPKTAVRHVVVAAMGDLLGLKGHIVNLVVRKVKKLVPAYTIPGSISFKAMLKEGQGFSLKPVSLTAQDIAFLQYTGGTTGVSKGAVLTHANLLANKLQISLWLDAAFNGRKDRPEVLNFICALPLCHIFALTVNSLMGIALGGHNLLIANPRDIPGFVKELTHYQPHIFPGINTLFNALMNNEDFRKLDLSSLILVLGGGMAVQRPVAERWLSIVGCPIAEGYGLSETSPVATVNRLDSTEFSGTIGLPISSTEIDIRDEDGNSLPTGEVGEICIRGPQVMAGYWQRPDETAKAMTADGFFRSGDMGFMDDRGYTKIVDRKKDMILVSGFNVYPNEVEEVAASHPGVLECAAIGVPDEHSGETVKLFVVKKDQSLTEAELKAFCAKNLTNYKRPKIIEFRTELPKSNVGKILRRELRNLN
ncbi:MULTISPECIES: long-chain fatty acid--CoA ligase [Agrobacterium]|uniref:long-chain fatty acid--CoA ligase n=1 Tax=Agrobacterium TaxID=357 RepID=UPI00049ED4D8|nr:MULTISPECIES: long-chain fatty acid--CoA ligase [Agrobacterium]KDR86330.1 long-chain fatty acid--CoA ligase [Agrobacterium tumefaciens GW4]KVK52362.1 long-chain fatty acid--CoA ligase [Agrobacterium sp. JL28]KVK53042.1 long-chain fatty acid--CoA ligase [Agrobacterium sp. LY4]KVK64704.1 long-chain fatty acid--CoA ligase [Agrobacterium sp. TS45]KVK68934.1 long-chain fatty acid--CoA ligase [Agrobacterium sp. C13]